MKINACLFNCLIIKDTSTLFIIILYSDYKFLHLTIKLATAVQQVVVYWIYSAALKSLAVLGIAVQQQFFMF